MEHGQYALLELFLIVCANIKVLLRDIEDSFNVVPVLRHRVELMIITGQGCLK